MWHCRRPLTVLAVIVLAVSTNVPCCLYAEEPVVQKLIEKGKVLKLKRDTMLGVVQADKEYFGLRSAPPGTADEFGSHYISIAMLADVILEPGDFQLSLKMGLVKLSKAPGPVMLSLKIGKHWYEFAFEDQKVTVGGVRLDAVRLDEMEMSHVVPLKMDGTPFTFDFTRVGGTLRIELNGQLLQTFWTEPTGGDLAICVERKSLLRVATSVNDTEAELHIYDWEVTGQFEQSTKAWQRWEKQSGDSWRLMKRIGNAYEYQKDNPDLPNVLIIGDSISIYYTDTVRRLLAGHADVYRTPMGPGKAETLFESLDEFLSNGRWDVIHFNSGLHDFARHKGTEENLQKYRDNLNIIIGKLRGTGAKLIWASTTPVPPKAPASITDDIRCQKYNATAQTLMNELGIPVNDLYSAVLPDHSRYWTAPNNIHFNSVGSAFLGRRVANAILPILKSENSSK
ncbi:SGNH/GDSL hydrolase family protein [uncultured Gimesia sp.]|uniref:SGNH/GDSL hydrolase family protein n=1 Tax=uncultured Gimesia sp. TaxID=1678688 RepID=UPI002618DF07|nr:SGNH/GDSL hydrolase family protein [uncultured Gimesia sp.]